MCRLGVRNVYVPHALPHQNPKFLLSRTDDFYLPIPRAKLRNGPLAVLPLHEKRQEGRRSHTRVLARMDERTSLAVYPERHDRIRALVTGVHETPVRIEGEKAWIVAPRGLFPDESQRSVGCDGKPGNRIVQPVCGIDEARIWRDRDFGGVVGAGKARRKRRNRLLCLQMSGSSVVIERHQRRTFLLERVEHSTVRMKGEVPWTIAQIGRA